MKISQADVIFSSGGPLGPSVGGTQEDALGLIPILAGMLAKGGRLFVTGMNGSWPNRSDYEENGLTVKNTFDVMNGEEMYVAEMPDR